MLVADFEPSFAFFEPRADQPERYDQQTAFFESQHTGVTFLIGGNGSGTTETALAKLADFVLQTPAPRWDTPVWIISEAYEMVCKTCWKAKLPPRDGHGHLPEEEIDWGRIRWYRPNQGWPFEVPLKPQRNNWGRNWTLCFKSYAQGRQQMQAESIGGFLFCEQFPWGLLAEVLRGWREWTVRRVEIAAVAAWSTGARSSYEPTGPGPGFWVASPSVRRSEANFSRSL